LPQYGGFVPCRPWSCCWRPAWSRHSLWWLCGLHPASGKQTVASARRHACSAFGRHGNRDLQADFVDDPQQAVREAGDLSREILRALSDTIADADRIDRWQAEDGTSGTEYLRIALRQYRTLVDRLLEL